MARGNQRHHTLKIFTNISKFDIMIDFNNLTEQQKEFFTTLWEQHAQQTEKESDSIKSFNDYIANRRQQEESQAKVVEILKSKMI